MYLMIYFPFIVQGKGETFCLYHYSHGYLRFLVISTVNVLQKAEVLTCFDQSFVFTILSLILVSHGACCQSTLSINMQDGVNTLELFTIEFCNLFSFLI